GDGFELERERALDHAFARACIEHPVLLEQEQEAAAAGVELARLRRVVVTQRRRVVEALLGGTRRYQAVEPAQRLADLAAPKARFAQLQRQLLLIGMQCRALVRVVLEQIHQYVKHGGSHLPLSLHARAGIRRARPTRSRAAPVATEWRKRYRPS